MSAIEALPLYLEPVARYATASRVDHFAEWTAEHCVQSVDQFAGEPLVLEDWQRAMMAEALAELGPNEAYWQWVALVIPKKNGKTSLLAAYALYHLLEDEGSPEILLAAATDKQAGRLFTTAVRFVKSDPWLAARLVVREHEGEIARADGFGSLFRLSADSGALSGYNPSLVVGDELADWLTPRRRRAWASIATGGLARRQVHVFVISTAGEPFERAEGILGQLIDRNELLGEVERVHRALTISRNHAGRTLVYNYDARTTDLADIDALKAANPASWVTRERLAELAASPSLSAGRFLQLHGCVWTASEAALLDLETWRSLAVEAEPEDGDHVTVGFRGAASCALVACRRSDATLLTLAIWDEPDPLILEAFMDDLMARLRLDAIYASTTPEWATLVDGWRASLGRRKVPALDIVRPSPSTSAITQRFRADAKAGRMHHDGNTRLAQQITSTQIARVRDLVYPVADRRGASIAAAQAALMAWEANVHADRATVRRGEASFL